MADARSVHDQDLQATAELLRALHWQFSLMAELPGKRTLPFGKGRRAAKDVARASRTLLDQLNLLRDGDRAERSTDPDGPDHSLRGRRPRPAAPGAALAPAPG